MKIENLLLVAVCLVFSGTVFAGEYTYRPSDFDLGDLDHSKAYSWGIDVSNPYSSSDNSGLNLDTETIIGASLFFDDIRNWDSKSNVLYVSLLDSPAVGLQVKTDSVPGFVNYFENVNSSTQLFELINLQGSSDSRHTSDITVNITDSAQSGLIGTPEYSSDSKATINMPAGGLSKLIAYASDGIFGLGIDPDCHFYNDGITLKLFTNLKGIPTGVNAVPEPATLILVGTGLLCFVSRIKKKIQV